jgi:hypothetical protein
MTRAVHYTATIDLARPFATRADAIGADSRRAHSRRADSRSADWHHADSISADPINAASIGDHSIREMRPVAYRMPFEVERFGSERIELRNASGDVLRWITIDLMGPGHFVAQTPAKLEPGQALAVWLFGDDLARQTKVQVTWFHEGAQYLWLVSL